MNSRQRILAAIEHKETERAPVDFGSNPASGISAIAYTSLKKYLGITTGCTRIYDVVQQLARPEIEILDRFGGDVVDIGRAFNERDEDWYDIKLPDGSTGQYPAWFRPVLGQGGLWQARSKGHRTERTVFDRGYFPYVDGYPESFKHLPEAMKRVPQGAFEPSPWDHEHEPDFQRQLHDAAVELRADCDRAIVICCGCNLFDWGASLRRMDNFLADIAADRQRVEALLDCLLELHLARLEKVCSAVGDIADIVWFADDFGMTSGPMVSPAVCRELFRPRYKLMTGYVHKNSRMKTLLHSCGSIQALLPDLMEAGFDIISPVQTDCRDMSPARLKGRFGNDICLWGGCEVGELLGSGTAEQVKKHVRERLEQLSPGGAYVFSTTADIGPDARPQNIVALFEAVRDFRGEF
jgi:uroporphyrinogen decarboxylase